MCVFVTQSVVGDVQQQSASELSRGGTRVHGRCPACNFQSAAGSPRKSRSLSRSRSPSPSRRRAHVPIPALSSLLGTEDDRINGALARLESAIDDSTSRRGVSVACSPVRPLYSRYVQPSVWSGAVAVASC